MNTVVVTGGAGYIGSHTLIELLNNSDFDILSLDNFSNSHASVYERVKKIGGRPFRFLDLDLCDYEKLDESLSDEKIAGIIHFAAFKSVPESVSDPLKYYDNNIVSLNNLLRFCRERNVRNFIFSSSCSVYGNADELPVTESTPMKRAESPYAHTKQIGEEIIRFFCQANPSLNAVLLRYFNPVGAHMSGQIGEYPLHKPNNLAPIITQTAVGKNSLTVFGSDYPTRDGYCVRDYIHVTDIADAHLKALDYLVAGKNKESVSLFNLGTGNGVSVMEVIQAFEKVTGIKLKYEVGPRRAGDVIAVFANNNLARKELGWNPRYSLDDMMLSAWKWQQTLESENV